MSVLYDVLYAIAPLVLAVVIVWILLKKMPILKQLNWKILAGLFIVLRLIDLYTTSTLLATTGTYQLETFFGARWVIQKIGPCYAALLFGIGAIALGPVLFKLLSRQKYHNLSLTIIVWLGLTCINNCLT